MTTQTNFSKGGGQADDDNCFKPLLPFATNKSDDEETSQTLTMVSVQVRGVMSPHTHTERGRWWGAEALETQIIERMRFSMRLDRIVGKRVLRRKRSTTRAEGTGEG